MLPDYRKIRTKISNFYIDVINNEKRNQLGFLNEVETSRIFEGRTIELKRQDGETDITEIKTFKTAFYVEKGEIEKLNFGAMIEKVKKASQEMNKQFFEYFMELMENTTTKTGNVVGVENNSITPEHLMKMYDKIFMDFDENLQPTKKVILTNNEGREQIIKAFEQIKNIPALSKKMNEIMEKKRREYIERENNRELVG